MVHLKGMGIDEYDRTRIRNSEIGGVRQDNKCIAILKSEGRKLVINTNGWIQIRSLTNNLCFNSLLRVSFFFNDNV